MNKKIILAIAAMMVMGLSIMVFAYTNASSSNATTMSCCCCGGDSCPMKSKDASGKATAAAAHDNCECCKGENSCTGDSCPMKKKGDAATTSTDMKHDAKATDTKSCCSCCTTKTKVVATYFKGKAVYKNDKSTCSCCNHDKDKEKKDAPTV